MKLLVLGSSSQLGQELTRLLHEQGIDYSAVTADEVDLVKPAAVLKAVARINPTLVVNVASFSSLEKAEVDPEASKQCDLVNTLGPTAIAEVCKTLKLPLIHHSSSFVFDGSKPQPYAENDEANPVSRYGLSKWYGERAIRDVLKKAIILRTDWLFSSHRNRLFSLHIEACKKNKGKIDVLEHRFSPTPAADVARVILAIAKQLDCDAQPWGTYHYCALQALSLEQFVESFLREASEYDKTLAAQMEKLEMNILPVEKPYIQNSALNCQKIMETFGITQRSRAAGVSEVLKDIYKIKLSIRKAQAKKTAPKKATKKNPKKSGNTTKLKKAAKPAKKNAAKNNS
jgi:dTDP-4-dehydrorhamnose reductase